MRICDTRQLLIALWCTTSALGCSTALADETLSQAIKSGKIEETRALLQSHEVDVLAAEPDGSTPLHWAANRNDAEAVAALINKGADVNANNRYGVTPLIAACMGSGEVAVIKLLIKAGADPDSALPSGQSAMMTAARTGKTDVVGLLIEQGARIEAREEWRGQNALMWAASEGHADTVRRLIKAGADFNARTNAGFTPLLFAVRAGRMAATEILLEAGADVNDKVTPAPGQLTVSLLPGNISGGQIPTAGGPGGTSALVVAITNGHFEMAKFLVEKGADPNAAAQGWTALHQLAHVRRPNLGKGMAPPEITGTIDAFALARALIEHGANINARMTRDFPMDISSRNAFNRIGSTPILLAAKTGDTPFMRLLADYGADVTIRNEEGTSTLMAAAGVGIYTLGESRGTNEEAFEAVKLAYELGDRDVNVIDNNGRTALHGAALRGANDIVQFLADKGARLDVVDGDGWLPLTIADGVHYTGTVKRAEHTAVLLRQLMREKGVLPPEMEEPSLVVSLSTRTPR